MTVKITIILTFLTLLTLTTMGQYPFEKYPAVKYVKLKNWKVDDKCATEKKVFYSVTTPNFFKNHDTLTIQLTSLTDNYDTSFIRIFRNKNQIQQFKESYGIGNGFECNLIVPTPQSIFLEDINGDGLKDLKILIPGNGCCGAYNFYLQVIYLFQKTDGTFTKISFSDLMMDYVNRQERDIDGDGNYEIITQTFKNFDNHNYWLFDLYSFNDDNLINVNYKLNYPIMIQLLNHDNYSITDKISQNKMKEFTKKLPDSYDKK